MQQTGDKDSTLTTDVNKPDVKAITIAQNDPNTIIYASEGNKVTASDKSGWLATFTIGSQTATVRGAERTFAEAGAADRVTHNVWVRILPSPFAGTVNEQWLSEAMQDTSPDMLAIAMEYMSGAPKLTDASGRVYAGDAEYGPLNPDGTRQEGSDFNDYLGIPYSYPDTVDNPEAAQLGSLDCSGYIRMIWGYRTGMPLTNSSDPRADGIPRRAVQMYDSQVGSTTIERSSSAQSSLAQLQPGDLVFQDASTDDGTAIDHVGMYLGKDTAGNYRFVSSRKTANGPTMGDIGGKSILNGSGLYAKSFVAAKRL